MSENQMNDENLSPELEDLLAGDWESLPDSNYDAWADGMYHASCTAAVKTVAGHPSVEFTFKMIEVKELADPSTTPPAVGGTNSELCTLDNGIGMSSFKKFLKVFGPHLGISNRKELVDAIQDVEVLLNNKRRYDKKNDVWRFRVDNLVCI